MTVDYYDGSDIITLAGVTSITPIVNGTKLLLSATSDVIIDTRNFVSATPTV